MRKLLLTLLPLLAALVTAPIIFLLTTVAVDRLGWRGFAPRVERLPLSKEMADLSALDAAFGEAKAITPLWVVATIALAIFVLLFALFRRLNAQHARGVWTVVLCSIATIPVYTYLAWDEPPVEFPPEQLEPGYGVAHVPREIALEATKDPTYGRAKDWPTKLFEPHQEPPSTEWLLKNAEQIRSHWDQLQPVRQWAAKLEAWPSYDDYVSKLSDPFISFQPVRQMMFGAQEYALLCDAENQPEEAAAALAETIRLGRRLEQGSRALVTLMVGAVVEKYTLRTIQTLCERHPNHRAIYAKALESAPTMKPWEDFERVLRNEVVLGQLEMDRPQSTPKSPPVLSAISPGRLLLNPHATARIYASYAEEVVASAKRGEFDSFKRREADLASNLHRFHFKNPAGRYVARQSPAAFEKVAQNLAELAKLRSEVLAIPNGP